MQRSTVPEGSVHEVSPPTRSASRRSRRTTFPRLPASSPRRLTIAVDDSGLLVPREKNAAIFLWYSRDVRPGLLRLILWPPSTKSIPQGGVASSRTAQRPNGVDASLTTQNTRTDAPLQPLELEQPLLLLSQHCQLTVHRSLRKTGEKHDASLWAAEHPGHQRALSMGPPKQDAN